MGLVFWWMLGVWAVAFGGYFLVRYFILKRWPRKQAAEAAVPIAHTDRLTALPEYKTALKRYRLFIKLAAGSLTLALLAGITLSARPASVTLITPAQQSRDIMLCLDVSGSVLRADRKLVNRFTTLVNSFTDQRFGLTVFNSSSISIIPLNNDYAYINEHLERVGQALTVQKGQEFTDLTSGTLADFDKGTSLVADGLVSCINNLGDNPQNRSQSIILATDNETNGKPIIDIKKATSLAEQKKIRIYAIDPGVRDEKLIEAHTQLKTLAEQTGGGYHPLKDTDVVATIIDGISGQEARYAANTPVLAVSDTPAVPLAIIVVTAIASLVLVWRLRL